MRRAEAVAASMSGEQAGMATLEPPK
jgi:hypothetical protein